MTMTYDEKGDLVVPTPSRIALHKASSIRRELTSVYRDMRNGKIEGQEGTKLAYVLDMLRKAHETEVLEKRLDEVQNLLHNRGVKL